MGDSSGFGVAAVFVRAQSEVSNVRGGRRHNQQTAYCSLVSDEGLFSQLHFSLSNHQHSYLSKYTRSSHLKLIRNHLFTCCTSFSYVTCVKLIQKSRLGQKQSGLTAKIPLKVHMEMPVKLKMTEHKSQIMKSVWFSISSWSNFHFELRNIHVWM